MLRRGFLWLIEIGFPVYVFLFAPPLRVNLLEPFQTLLEGQIPSINPVTIALFSMIGIWILIYSCLTFPDGRMQKLPAWAFMIGSAATGILSLIPYLALREPNQQFSGEKDTWIKWLDSPAAGLILTVSTLFLLGFAVIFGDWSAFVQVFRSDRFIHAMTLAFFIFCLLFPYPTLLSDDMARRGLRSDSQLFWIVALVPLFGPLLYLCIRPPLLMSRSQTREYSGSGIR
ncbi:hypothetical protein [Leptolyngbya ohadii]|uniref:hypothetical protein n=1 Tax=Leptolyngbya ohadii TaxID=1962290 RepID=UPI000B5987F8|nr:hypothetical protein [Leptolyngbya ohadii]